MPQPKIIVQIIALLFCITCNVFCSADIQSIREDNNLLLDEAHQLYDQGSWRESTVFYRAAKKLQPKHPHLKALEAKYTPKEKNAIVLKTMLGVNKTVRRPSEVTGSKHTNYFMDRVNDLIDIATIEFNVGPQVGFSGQVTKTAQAVAYAGATVGVGTYQKNRVGYRLHVDGEAALFPVGPRMVRGMRNGSDGYQSGREYTWLQRPDQDYYQEYEDYWAIGTKAGALVGTEFKLHPVEFADFFCGLIGIDLLDDDDSKTRDVEFSEEQEDLLERTGGYSDSEISLYRDAFPVDKNGSRPKKN